MLIFFIGEAFPCLVIISSCVESDIFLQTIIMTTTNTRLLCLVLCYFVYKSYNVSSSSSLLKKQLLYEIKLEDFDVILRRIRRK